MALPLCEVSNVWTCTWTLLLRLPPPLSTLLWDGKRSVCINIHNSNQNAQSNHQWQRQVLKTIGNYIQTAKLWWFFWRDLPVHSSPEHAKTCLKYPPAIKRGWLENRQYMAVCSWKATSIDCKWSTFRCHVWLPESIMTLPTGGESQHIPTDKSAISVWWRLSPSWGPAFKRWWGPVGIDFQKSHSSGPGDWQPHATTTTMLKSNSSCLSFASQYKNLSTLY